MRITFICLLACSIASSLLAAPAEAEPSAKLSEEALASMVARPGFRVELVACEPLTMDPVAFAWGADARLWIVEMADYPLGIDGKGTPGGRVRFLEDRDGDGKYDTSALFLEGLSYPNGILPWRKGVLVTCAPEIFYAEDTDGDGRADVRKTLYRGFGEGNPQHRVNGLRWGLDNWVYCANGDSGGGIESLVTGEKVNIGGRDFRIRPDAGLIEAQTGQTQFMRERDDWGNWFGNNNANPMYHFALDDHYLRRNPHLTPPEPRAQVSLAPGAAPVFPASHTPPRFNDQNATNRFTSACSAIIYRDDLFGPQFAGNSFVSEPVHNLVHREVVFADGFTFHSRRAEDEQHSEFLASTDNWCRPAMIRVGPDGALWVADMYRQVIEHPEWIPKEVQAKYDLRAGSDKGRIYRVYPADHAPRRLPRLGQLDIAGLVAAFDSPSGWQRDMVQQLLIERNDPAAVPLLKALLADATKPVLARLHALCTLDGLQAIDAALLRSSIGIHPGVDRHVVRLSEPFLNKSSELAAKVVSLVSADDPQLLMQVAYSLGEWQSPESGQALGRLALRPLPLPPGEGSADVAPSKGDRRPHAPREETHHAERDAYGGRNAQQRPLPKGEGIAYLQAAILSSITAENLSAFVNTVFASPEQLAGLDDYVRQIGMLTGLMDGRAAQLELLRLISSAKPNEIAAWQFAALDGVLAGFARRGKALDQFWRDVGDSAGEVQQSTNALVSRAEQAAGDPLAEQSQRLLAIRLLGRVAAHRQADLDLLSGLLSPQTPAALESAAVAALASVGDRRVPELLLNEWSGYGPELRGQVVDVLLGREAWLEQLVTQIESGSMTALAIDAPRRQRLLEHPKEAVRQRAQKLFSGTVNSDRQQVVDRYRDSLTLAAETGRGAAVFKKVCATCHRLSEMGHAVGPDLSALSDRSPQAMLTAIFDPNRAVEAKFLNYTAITADGLTLTGMLASESGNSITLLAADGKTVTLLRSNLEALASSTKSLMPEGLEKDLSLQDTADLLAYLSGFRPPRKTFEGNEPKVVMPEGLRGEFWLLAENAEVYGKTLVFEPPYRNLGYWQSDDDHAVWSIDVAQPGKYAVSLDYACDNGSSGQSLVLEVAGQRLSAKVPGTGNWDTYRPLQLGKVELPGGSQQVVVRPDGALHGALIDLKSVRLRPLK